MYVVPDGSIILGGVFINERLKEFPEQVDKVWFGICGLGLTVTVNVKVLLHVLGAVPVVAVIVYITSIGALVVLVNVWPIEVTGVVWLEAPVIPAGLETVHVKVVPVGKITLGGLLIKESVKALPEQTVNAWAGTRGAGFTVITKFTGVPTQPLLEGVTV